MKKKESIQTTKTTNGSENCAYDAINLHIKSNDTVDNYISLFLRTQ